MGTEQGNYWAQMIQRRYSRRVLMRGVLLSLVCAAGLLAAIPAHSSASVAPAAPTISAGAPVYALQVPDKTIEVNIGDRGGARWYRSPVWIAIGAIAIVVVLLLVILAARGGGGRQETAIRSPHLRHPRAARHPGGAADRGQVSRGHAHPAGQSPQVDLEEASLNLHLTGHHVEITPSIRQYVESKLERINRHFDHVIDVNVFMTVEKLDQKIEANVHLSGKDIHVRANDADMYAAIDGLVDKLDRQPQHVYTTADCHHGDGRPAARSTGP